MLTVAFLVLLVLCLASIVDDAGALPEVPGLEAQIVTIPSSRDGRDQPVVVALPAALRPDTPAPLLVGIHTWSADYRQQLAAMGPLAVEWNWRLILPDFRGPNLASNPRPTEAGGSLLAQQDILDAVQYVSARHAVDADRCYLLGGSGGGHMSLLTAAKSPDLWAGVSAWCPVSDLRDWHAQGNSYAPHVAAVCGGLPGSSPEVDFEYLRRSPRTFLTNLANTPVRISHGDRDPVIWVNQTWQSYERLRGLPHRVEFQSWSGGHDMHHAAGMAWLAEQRREVTPPTVQKLVSDAPAWYFWLHLEPAAPLTFARAEAEFVRGEAGADHELRLRVAAARAPRLRLAEFGVRQITGVTAAGAPLALTAGAWDGQELTLPDAPESGCDYVVHCC